MLSSQRYSRFVHQGVKIQSKVGEKVLSALSAVTPLMFCHIWLQDCYLNLLLYFPLMIRIPKRVSSLNASSFFGVVFWLQLSRRKGSWRTFKIFLYICVFYVHLPVCVYSYVYLYLNFYFYISLSFIFLYLCLYICILTFYVYVFAFIFLLFTEWCKFKHTLLAKGFRTKMFSDLNYFF